MSKVKRALSREGYRIQIIVNDRKAVAVAWLKFSALPHDIDLISYATLKKLLEPT